jgi:hypothetical protein
MDFQAYCPECQKTVSADLRSDTLENLQTGKGDVVLGHLTDDPRVGDHTWVVNDSKVRANIKEHLAGYPKFAV